MNHLSIEELVHFNSLESDYDKAYYLVSILFAGKTDKEGEPYIGHLVRVASRVEGYNTKVAALLHDAVEDIPGFTFEDLDELGFNEEVIELVRLVTKDPNLSYHERISKILESGNNEAIELKYSDMSDNINPERLSRLDEETRNRLYNKYKDEYQRLEKKLTEIKQERKRRQLW